MIPAEVDIGLGLLDLGHHPRLELCYMVVNPGGIAGGHCVHTRSVGGPTGITPAHDACQVPEASSRAGEWAPRVTLSRKAMNSCQDQAPGLESPMPALSSQGALVSCVPLNPLPAFTWQASLPPST